MTGAPRLLAATLATLGALALGACGDDDDSPVTFENEGFPFTFEYPGDWEESDDVSIDQSLGGASEETTAVALDDENGIVLQRYTLQKSVDENNLDLAQQEIEGLLTQVDPAAKSKTTEIAGLPALTVESLQVPSIDSGESRLVFLFDGDQEYLINCQSTEESRAEIADACDTAVRTLTLD
jgi:hypothetical protein